MGELGSHGSLVYSGAAFMGSNRREFKFQLYCRLHVAPGEALCLNLPGLNPLSVDQGWDAELPLKLGD